MGSDYKGRGLGVIAILALSACITEGSYMVTPDGNAESYHRVVGKTQEDGGSLPLVPVGSPWRRPVSDEPGWEQSTPAADAEQEP